MGLEVKSHRIEQPNMESSRYNPYENREITSKSASNFEVFIHMIKGSFGIGILGLPYSVHRSGYLISIIIGLPLVFIVIYGIHVLIRTMVKISEMEQQPHISYEDCVKMTVLTGPKKLQKTAVCAKYTVRILLIVFPVAIAAAYIIFIAHSIDEFYTLVGNTASQYIYMVIFLPPLFLINCIPNLHRMVVFSAVANVLTLVCFGLLFYCIFITAPHKAGEHDMIGKHFYQLPLIIGPGLFAIEAISVILSLEERMKTPEDFLGILGVYNISMAIVVLFYFLFGTSAYFKYGDSIKPNLASNLPTGWVSESFRILYIIIIFLTYPLHCYPVIALFWEDNLSLKVPNENKRTAYKYLFRFGLTLVTVVVAAIIPKFEVIVTLVAAVCISSLGLFLPCYMEFLLNWNERQGKYNMTMIKDISMMILGALIFVVVIPCTIIDEIIGSRSRQTKMADKLYGL